MVFFFWTRLEVGVTAIVRSVPTDIQTFLKATVLCWHEPTPHKIHILTNKHINTTMFFWDSCCKPQGRDCTQPPLD